MADPEILSTVRTYLARERAHGIPVEFGVLFGSWSRGQASPLSDIDLLVVSPRFDAPRARRDVAALWRIAAGYSRIEPVPCGSKQWREDQGESAFGCGSGGGGGGGGVTEAKLLRASERQA